MGKFEVLDKKHVIMTLVLTHVLLYCGIKNTYAQFAGGYGTAEEPWLIEAAVHLDNIRDYLGEEHDDKHFLQIDNINLDIPPWNQSEGWVPIGFSNEESFQGTYNGNDHIINGLYINRPDVNLQGLFGLTRNSKISNLSLTNVNITGYNAVGSLIGQSFTDRISKIHSSGSSNGVYNIGGLIGAAGFSIISDLNNSCNVSGDANIGGLVGFSFSSEVRNSVNSGTVAGNWSTGGIAGVADEGLDLRSNASTNDFLHITELYRKQRYINSKVEHCFNIGVINGNNRSGGVVGFLYGGSQLSNSYNFGEVNGYSQVGGLAGNVYIFSYIQNCYSAETVAGDIDIGGLIGMIDYSSSVTNSYWNIETSGQAESADGEGRTTDEMTYPYAMNTYVDWDFVEIWTADVDYTINQGYPYLQEIPVSVEEEFVTVLESPTLTNFPNPFNPETTISFTLPQETEKLELKIYNIRGQLVRTLIAGTPHSKGEYRIVWDGRNDFGSSAASGVYFYRVTTPSFNQINKMLLLK